MICHRPLNTLVWWTRAFFFNSVSSNSMGETCFWVRTKPHRALSHKLFFFEIPKRKYFFPKVINCTFCLESFYQCLFCFHNYFTLQLGTVSCPLVLGYNFPLPQRCSLQVVETVAWKWLASIPVNILFLPTLPTQAPVTLCTRLFTFVETFDLLTWLNWSSTYVGFEV